MATYIAKFPKSKSIRKMTDDEKILFRKVRKKLGMQWKELAEIFGYASKNAFQNSNQKFRIMNGLAKMYNIK